jgi:hypothetical protein
VAASADCRAVVASADCRAVVASAGCSATLDYCFHLEVVHYLIEGFYYY